MTQVGNIGEGPRCTTVETLISITQIAFQEGRLTEDLTWMTMVLMQKGGVDFRIIELVYVI